MTDFDPDRMYASILQAGEEWADRKAAYEALEDMSKTVLADLILATPATEQMSMSLKEHTARASQNWKDHLNALSLARKIFLLSEVRYKALVSLSEWRRSQEASRRTEARIV